jgi:phospholipase C
VAPEAYTEHPNWPANYGAWYVSQILDALTDHPDVWSKTAFFSTYDENDGFFDHVVPPTVPQTRAQGLSNVDITNEIFPGSSEYPPGPYGMGIRVPMIVVSPWSKGGWVNSQVFDHTSLIRFIESRFGAQYPGIMEGNITKWRRAVSGDLTSAFNFTSPNDATVQLPSTVAYIPPDDKRHKDYVPVPPEDQSLPVQESGVRPARALPYELHVRARTDLTHGAVNIYFGNSGKIAAVYQVYSADGRSGPWTYTVAPDTELSDSWNLTANDQTDYDLSVFGPNGFLRVFKGSIASGKANIASSLIYNIQSNGVILGIHNRTGTASTVSVFSHYTHKRIEFRLEEHREVSEFWSLDRSYGWYDFTITTSSDSSFQQRLAGHLETGRDSMSDPAIGTVHPQEEASLKLMATSPVKA